MRRFKWFICVLTALALCACNRSDNPQEFPTDAANKLNVVAELAKGPGNITVTAAGQIIVSLHQFYNHDVRVAVINDSSQLVPFATEANVNSVLGVQANFRRYSGR